MDPVYEDNLELSRYLYPRSEIEFMILKCILEKHEYTFQEDMLFWVAEYTVSYGLEQTWLFIRYVYVYSLLCLDHFKFATYAAKRYEKYKEKNSNDIVAELPSELIDCIRTLRNTRPNIAIYTFIYMYTFSGSKFKKNMVLYRKYSEKALICTEQYYNDYHNDDDIHVHVHVHVHKHKLQNVYQSLVLKDFPTIMYYMQHFERHTWIRILQIYFKSGMELDVVEQQEDHQWVILTIQLVKYLLGLDIESKSSSVTFIKGTSQNQAKSREFMRDTQDIKPLHPDVIKQRKCCLSDINEINYHTQYTMYWKTRTCDKNEELLAKHELWPLSSCSQPTVLPNWICKHDKTGYAERIIGWFS